MTPPALRRVLVKVSGEALNGPEPFGLHVPTVTRIAEDLARAAEGRQIAVVVGGGNFFRGLQAEIRGFDRATGDSIGMLATVMNALALEQAIEAAGQTARAMSAIPMPSICEPYARQTALAHLKKGRVLVLAGGTGNPYFTTDSGAALRAIELKCDALVKATKVDGVYTADPKLDPTATRYETLTHREAITADLKIMDTAAFALARENRLPIIVCSLDAPGAVTAVLAGQGRCTWVTP